MAYNHPYPPADDNNRYQINNLHQAMDYNASGQPVVRTLASSDNSTKNPQIDGFGRQRTADPFTLFDAQLKYTKRSDLFDESVTGNASTTYQINESTLDLEVTTTNGDHVIRETKRVFPYQPGKSLQTMMSFVMDAGQSGLTQCVGMYDTQNGVFFMNKDGVNYLVRRSYTTGVAVDEEIAQTNWNIDKLDGTTSSGIDLDITKAQILFLDVEWLGVGQVRMGFIINGNFYFAHAFQHANILDKVYMTTAVLPLRYEIQNTADTVASSTMKQICCTVISEGGYTNAGPTYFVDNGTTGKTMSTSGTFYPFISIRLNSSRLNSVVVLRQLNMLILSNQNVLFKLLLNPSLTISGSPVVDGNWSNHTNGTVQYINHAPTTHSFTGGTELAGGWLSTDSGTAGIDGNNLFAFQLGRFLNGTSDILTVVAAPTNNNVTASALLGWAELV